MSLCVIIPCLEDHAQINLTIASIRATTPGKDVEIIVVDDFSKVPVSLQDLKVRLIRLTKRVGGGMARHIGALRTQSEFILFIDSHMRFKPGWLEASLDRIQGRPRMVHVAQCLGLSQDNMDVNRPKGSYFGAKMIYIGKDPNKPDKASILEGAWSPSVKDDSEVECMMGACYFWPRALFFKLGGKTLLRDWGQEETYTSIKVWLAGGCIRLMKDVQIGHMFRKRNGYGAPWESIAYNKLLVARVCMPRPAARAIEEALRKQLDTRFMDTANRWLQGDDRLVQAEWHRMQALTEMPFEKLISRWGHKKFW